MIRPIRATYGTRDNMHTLLTWDGHSSQPPPWLLGLTDKPPGVLAPGERWWPSVGCGPVGESWALWWTRPDERAQRGGMVFSQVALWPLEEIGAVDDLRPVLAALSGQETIVLPVEQILGAVAEALLSRGTKPAVLLDLDIWPGVLAAIWMRLWPALRREFSARVAISPPQGGESVAPPWLYCVPSSRGLQWSEHPQISLAARQAPTNRAVRWFMGQSDAVFSEVLAECRALPTNVGVLAQVTRAADRLDRMREVPTAQHALDLLRTIGALRSACPTGSGVEGEAMGVLAREVAGAPVHVVCSLANLELTSASAERVASAVQAWTRLQAPALVLANAIQLLERLAPGWAHEWWQTAVRDALRQGLSELEPRWAAAALHWLGDPRAEPAVRALLPGDERVESGIVAATAGVTLELSQLPNICARASERGWSRLHAWAVMQTSPPLEALRMQRTRFGARAGLELLIERLPGDEVVRDAVSYPDSTAHAIVASRTKRELELLRPLDGAHAGWRALWAAHVDAGGEPWPPDSDRRELGRALLAAACAGDEPTSLLVALSAELAPVAVEPGWGSLWPRLSVAARNALVPRVVDVVIDRCESGEAPPHVERPIAEAVVARFTRRSVSARLCGAVLRWEVALDEHELVQWVRHAGGPNWAAVAESLGRYVLVKKWKMAAEAIFDQIYVMPELRAAALECQELLGYWYRFKLSWSGTWDGARGQPALVRRVAELGANLAPEELDDVWERAGGKRKQIRVDGTPEVRWREAATLAGRGGLEKGLAGLVRELRGDFPFNPELKELDGLLGDDPRRGR